MLISLEEAKNYLRQDSSDDDMLITQLTEAASKIVMDVARLDEPEMVTHAPITRTAVLYALAYLYEHREEADHHALVLDLRNILFTLREAAF